MKHKLSPRSSRSIVVLSITLSAGLTSDAALARGGAPIVAEWTTATSGDWDDDTRWSSPTYPDNGFPGAGDVYSAVFGAGSATDYTVRLPSPLDISLDTLDIDAQGLSLIINGALGVEHGATVRQGRVQVTDGTISGRWDFRDSNLLIQSGAFRDFTLQHNASSSITFGERLRFEGQNDFGGFAGNLASFNGQLGFEPGAVLDNASLSFPINLKQTLDLPSGAGGVFGEDLSITGGELVFENLVGKLTSHGQMDLRSIDFSIGAILDNRGELIIDSLEMPISGSLTNRGLMVPDHADLTRGTFTNASGGVLRIEDDGFARLRGSWLNQGTIDILDGVVVYEFSNRGANDGVINIKPEGLLELSGSHSPESLGTVNNDGGSVHFNGPFNNAGHTMSLGGNFENRWALSGGSITGGAIDATNIRNFASVGGMLIDAQLDTHTLKIEDNILRLKGATEVNAVVLDFADGDGSVFLEDESSISAGIIVGRTRFGLGQGAELTFPKGLSIVDRELTISGDKDDPTQLFRNETGLTITANFGSIEAGEIQNSGEFTIDGEGGSRSFYLESGRLLNEGDIHLVDGGRIFFDAPIENTGTVHIDGGQANVLGAQLASDLGDWQINNGFAFMWATLDLGDEPFEISNYTDRWLYRNATLSDGVIDASPGVLIEVDNAINLLNTQIIGDLSTNQRGRVRIQGDFSTVGGSLSAGEHTVIDVSQQSVIDHSTIKLNNSTLETADEFTIGADAAITGNGRLEMPTGSTLTIDGTLEVNYGGPSEYTFERLLFVPSHFQLINNGVLLATGAGRIDARATAPIVNNGLIATRDEGELEFRDFEHNGEVRVEGGLFHLSESWSGEGSFDLAGGELRYGVNAQDQLERVTRSGGLLTLTGDLDLSEAALELDSLQGPWRFLGGSVANGAITPSPMSRLVAEGVLLDSVLVQGPLALHQEESVRFRGSTDITGGLTLDGEETSVTLESPWAVAGNTLTFSGSRASMLIDPEASLTIQSDSVLHLAAELGNISAIPSESSLGAGPSKALVTNHGQIIATGDTAPMVERYDVNSISAPFVNNGTIRVQDHGALYLDQLQGTTGDIAVRDSFLSIGGEYSVDQPLRIESDSTLELSGLWRNDSVIELQNSELRLDGSYAAGDVGEIQADEGSSIVLGGQVVDEGATFFIDNESMPWSIDWAIVRGGRIETTSDGFVDADGLTLREGAVFAGNLSMTEDLNRFELFDDAQVEGVVEFGGRSSRMMVYQNHEIRGMHLVSTFDDTAAGSVHFPSINLRKSFPEEESPHMILAEDASLSGQNLTILSSGIFTGNGPSLLTSYGLIHSNTEGKQIAIETIVSMFPSPNRDRDGMRGTAQPHAVADQRTQPFEFENFGILKASNGGAVVIRDGSGFRNIIDSTLTGGTYIVEDASTIDFGPGGHVSVNNASITISGPTADFSSIAWLNENCGAFNLIDGHRFETLGDLNNIGMLAIDSDSFLRVDGDFEQGIDATLQLMIGDSKIAKKGLLRSGASLALDGALEIQVEEGAVLVPGQSWKILTSKGGRSGEFASLITPDLGPHLGFELEYSGKAVTLLVIPSPSSGMPLVLLAVGAGVRRARRCA